MYFIVFLTYVFYFFCCFISFITTIQLFWPQNKHLNFKQDWITNVLSIFRKNDFYICFVHKSQKWVIFGLTCKDKRSRDLVTVGPIFEKNRFKRYVRLEREKSWKENFISAAVFGVVAKFLQGGGQIDPPPPPPVNIGLTSLFLAQFLCKMFTEFLPIS